MNKILKSTRFVVDHSAFVTINHDKVVDFSNSYTPHEADHWIVAAPFAITHLPKEERLHFVFLFNALSFCYWGEPKWTVDYQGKQEDGAWGMILALGRAVEAGVPLLDFNFCSTMSREQFANILRGNIEIPLFEERLKIVREIGEVMADTFDGKARNLVSAADGDGITLLNLIIQYFTSFHDVSPFQGNNVYFYKRAQLLTTDIHHNFESLKNLDQITAFADYKVPQILRKFGVLEYAPDLAKRIDNKIELPKDSAEEVEIRASAIWAIELMRQELSRKYPDSTPYKITSDLWLATQNKQHGEQPYHRTRTTAY